MPLSWNEIRNRTHEFSKRWKNETSEDAEAKAQRLPPHGKPDNLVADSLLGASGRCQALDAGITGIGGTEAGRYWLDQPRNDSPAAKKNCLKPWCKVMWCIGALTEEYRERMYDLLDLYARPFQPKEPVVCLDEKSKQLLKDSRPALPVKHGSPAKQDYEYNRAGTCNLFVAVEPKGPGGQSW